MRGSRPAVLLIALAAACAAPPAPRAAPAPSPAPAPLPRSAPLPPAIHGERGDLMLADLDGNPVRLARFGARVTIVSVWSTGCVPCIKELPYIEALYQSYRGDPDVAVLSLAEDDPNNPQSRRAVAEIARRNGLHMPVLLDRNLALYRLLNGEDGPGGKKHLGLTIPLLAIIDSAFDIRRVFGFKTTQTVEAFVRDQRVLVGLALRGRLPPEDPPLPPPEPRGPDACAGGHAS